MTRILAIALAASAISLWAVSSKASDWQAHGNSMQSQPSLYMPVQMWPLVNHAPAITKTLQPMPLGSQPAPQPKYDYQWQRQPSLPPPTFGAPQFTIPQQGYYPREGTVIPQAPGYEYGSGGAGTYPPLYPMEGANWRGPRAVPISATASPESSDAGLQGTYHDCYR